MTIAKASLNLERKRKPMAKQKKTEVAIVNDNSVPDYLTGQEKTGIEALGREDFKVQRIKLLQPMSPEVRIFTGKALPTEFWHTGANVSLGLEFYAVPIIVNKKIILFPPRDSGDDRFILAFSKDGLKWDTGGNQKFEVTLKDKTKVVWDTHQSPSSMADFGSSNPLDSNSQPAAMRYYEYLLYLRDYPDLSPAVLSAFRTGLSNAMSFNTFLASRARKNIPANCSIVKFFSQEKNENKNVWHVTGFQPAGNASREIFEITEKMKENYAGYETQIDRDDMQAEVAPLKSEDI